MFNYFVLITAAAHLLKEIISLFHQVSYQLSYNSLPYPYIALSLMTVTFNNFRLKNAHNKNCTFCAAIRLECPVTWYGINYAGTQVQIHSGTSKTKELLSVQPDIPLFWKSHCVTCLPA